jgi:hypothetical protein
LKIISEILIFEVLALHRIIIPLSFVGLKTKKVLSPSGVDPLCHTIS